MAEQISDGYGSGNYAVIDNSRRLWTVGSITSFPKAEVYISGIVNDFTTIYKQYMDYQGGYQPIYIGLALPGTGSETASWMLRKNIYENDLNVAVLFGSGNINFDKKWSDRADANAVYN